VCKRVRWIGENVVVTKPPSATRRAVSELLDQGLTPAEIARRLGISAPAVCHHTRALGYDGDERFRRRYDWAAVQSYYDEGRSAAECREHFGFAKASWDSAVKDGRITPRAAATPIADLLVHSARGSRRSIKRRLLAEGLKAPRCETCGLTEWLGREIQLELHHINGDGQDNRLENLQILCPNCHAQTENFGVRNRVA
jgi:hypothetical protein